MITRLKQLMPSALRDWLYRQRQRDKRAWAIYQRQRMYAYWRSRREVDTLVPFAGFTARINDGAEYVTSLKTVLEWGIYAFRAQRSDPLIIDAGSNIGMTILYFKSLYPSARIIGFEPDPDLLPLLYDNIRRNELKNVEIVEAALSDREEVLTLHSKGHASTLYGAPDDTTPTSEVRSVRLRDYLNTPVDFLKMNIEGAEWTVLADCADVIQNVREMVVEYHHFPNLPRTLHLILDLLHRSGFEYTVTDFNDPCDGAPTVPYHLAALDNYYYVLVYARRRDIAGH